MSALVKRRRRDQNADGRKQFRGDANGGPNPGGGFYGAPNLNVGRINP
jgi:hypothetical protein